ncbi:MAG: DUF554 domain-containing protein [Oscillospiraceae bacterium]|nr:DUF554 domain-containing protein [Oscillospiraceae bacterium]MBR2421326.1 DUF554 domain-containing protein [Oscillospiraceae bacterium]
MPGVIVNVIAVLLGASIGLFCKRGIPSHLTDAVMTGLGLCTLYVGIDGALAGGDILILIGSMVLGAITGTLMDIDGAINRLGTWVETRFRREGEAKISIAEGFVTATLLFCVGSMTVVGSLNAGISGDYEMLFTKSILDFVAAIMLAASLGVGVAFSAVSVLVIQGGIALLASLIAPVLTTSAIAEMTCAGSLLIIALSFNLIGVAKIKVANYLPAIVFAPVLVWLVSLFPALPL